MFKMKDLMGIVVFMASIGLFYLAATWGMLSNANASVHNFFLNLDMERGQIVNNSSFNIEGQSSPNATIFINDKELKANNQGNFVETITLDEGENTVFVVAHDDEGNYKEEEIGVTLQTLSP